MFPPTSMIGQKNGGKTIKRNCIMRKHVNQFAAILSLLSALLPIFSSCVKVAPETDSEVSLTGNEVCISVSARRGETRAAYDETTWKMTFTTGDQLLVKGSHVQAGSFSGILDYVSENAFYGKVTTENPFDGKAPDLLSGATTATAVLLPAGYTDYGFITLNGTELEIDANKALTTSKELAVTQFSLEQASSYSEGFTLSPANSIVVCSVSDFSDAFTSQEVAFTVKGDYETYISKSMPGSSTLAFALPEGVYSGLKVEMTQSGGTRTFLVGDRDVEKSRVYNLEGTLQKVSPFVDMSNLAVGMLIASDGKIYANKSELPSGVTATGMIAYAGHRNGEDGYGPWNPVYNNGLAVAFDNHDGADRTWTASIANAATNVNVPRPDATTDWFIPSVFQWMRMFEACGGSTFITADISTWQKYTDFSIGNFNELIKCGGSGNTGGGYWTSTRGLNEDEAWYFSLQNGRRRFISIGGLDTRGCNTRGVFAF